LTLSWCNITDDHISSLTRLKKLKVLWIIEKKLTDSCIETLLQLESLEFIDVKYCNFTESGIKRLGSKVECEY
jgi:hypothetical protein